MWYKRPSWFRVAPILAQPMWTTSKEAKLEGITVFLASVANTRTEPRSRFDQRELRELRRLPRLHKTQSPGHQPETSFPARCKMMNLGFLCLCCDM